MITPPCASECAGLLRDEWRGLGMDIHVTSVAPLIPGAYPTFTARCPHGVCQADPFIVGSCDCPDYEPKPLDWCIADALTAITALTEEES